jgi:hypothetical protein
MGLPGLLLSPGVLCVWLLTECAHRVESKIISSSRQVKICVNLFHSNKALSCCTSIRLSYSHQYTALVSVCVFLYNDAGGRNMILL